jgi:hypothetical protein
LILRTVKLVVGVNTLMKRHQVKIWHKIPHLNTGTRSHEKLHPKKAILKGRESISQETLTPRLIKFRFFSPS